MQNNLYLQGVPKKNGYYVRFWVFDFGKGALEVKNNSKNFLFMKNFGLFGKILSKWTLII